MAQQVVKTFHNVVGQLFEVTVQVTHTAVTSSVLTPADHGLTNIVSVATNNETTAGAPQLVQMNKNASGASIGSIYTTSATSGDVITYIIKGR